MEKVSFKNSLDVFVKENKLISDLALKIKSLPEFDSLKLDVELTLYVAKVIENEILKKTPEERKKLIIKVIQQIHPLNPAELKILESQINFLSDHKKITKQSTSKAFCNFLSGWIVKKIL
jgi:translation initiation factor 2B subunit (eIF-2B alpha/beta/delta family)